MNWSKVLRRPEILRYMKNSLWMLSEYGMKVVSAIFVTIYVARYLGPEQFGVLSYALAIVAVFMALSRLGMESILVRDLALFPERRQAFMSTAFTLMVMASFVSFVLLSGLVLLLEESYENRIYIFVISMGIIFQAFSVVEYNFQSQVKAKYSSIAKSLSLVVSAATKILLVWLEAGLIFFAASYLLDFVVTAAILLAMNFKKSQPNFFCGYDSSLLRPLLKSAWPMMLSAISVSLYSRIDQIMLKSMVGLHELGVYAAAIKVFEGWMIVPYVISISLLPAIVRFKAAESKSYEKNMAILFAFLFWSSALVALFFSFFGEFVISMTFGSKYLDSASILVVVMWSATFAALGSITARYLTVEGMESKILSRTLVGLIVNVLLNLVLIPVYGVQGAAISTMVTLFVANYLINYFDRDLKQLVSICNRSLTLGLVRNEK
ncbi:flippase [Pseudomonas flexibilis]|nr:flippase [Pseudomonas flexibilis]